VGAAAAIYAKLSGDSGVTAITTRIRPLQSDQADAVPRVVYDAPDGERPRHYRGSTGQTKATVTIAAIAATYAGSIALAKAVRDCLDNGRGTWGGVTVQGCFFNTDSMSDSRESAGDTGPDNPAYIREAAFTIWVKE
jgi:hypothetical protein